MMRLYCAPCIALAAAAAVLSGCGPRLLRSPSGRVSATPVRNTSVAGPVQFVDITDQAGIRFVHDNGGFGKKWMPETTGGACAFIDYDKDGREDILLVNSGQFETPAASYKARDSRTRVTLYHNKGDGTFEDVTARSGLRVEGYGQGVCVGDFDNDGWDDIYVTCLGANHLFRNRGDGTFQDVTAKAGVAGAKVNGGLKWKWSSSCAWLDYDRDGYLDLFVCNFVEWSPDLDVFCGFKGGKKDYCAPDAYKGLACTLYHNNHDGTFTDVSVPTQISESLGKSWGVVVWDYNGDGWPDIAVANDRQPNFLFVNHEGKYFTEEAPAVGIALSEGGHPKSGMGIDVADWNDDGHDALLIGNFSNEKLSLFTPDAPGLMSDIADRTGLGQSSLKYLTFGCFFFDYDLDGWPDAFAANGHIQEFVEEIDSGITFKERPLLYHNEGNGTFAEVGLKSGAPLAARYVLRGCACADIDNDGDLDLLVVENNGRARLWRNDLPKGSHWLRIQLVGHKSNRDGIGALVKVRAGAMTQRQWVKSGSSFMSQSSLRLTFGLGKAPVADDVEILWPSGVKDVLHNVALNRQFSVEEGSAPVAK
jgi:enediyne biosynthesis protein E4